jgi:hypothetical protein
MRFDNLKAKRDGLRSSEELYPMKNHIRVEFFCFFALFFVLEAWLSLLHTNSNLLVHLKILHGASINAQRFTNSEFTLAVIRHALLPATFNHSEKDSAYANSNAHASETCARVRAL